MFRGFYTATAGMMAEQSRTNMITNNMANANTPGYKEDQASFRTFPKMLLEQINSQSPLASNLGTLSTGVYMQEAVPNFTQGALQETDNKTDMALVDVTMPANAANGTKGTVFFTVQNPNGGVSYTRDGNFALDGQGYLTNDSGQYILDNNGKPIQLSSNQFTVSNSGLITGQNGQQAQLGIAYSANPDQLSKEGGGLYNTTNGTALPSAANQNGVQFNVQQGFLEQSNVDMNQSMTDMMNAYQSFATNQKVIQTYDQSMDLACNQVGKVGS